MKPPTGTGSAAASFRRQQFAAPLNSLLAILHSPLTRNGYALVMSAGITSVLGLLFWVIAARLYPADQVGLGGAMLAALLTLGNFAQLNLDTVLNRFLPIAGPRTGQMISWSYAASIIMALVISSVFILLTSLIAPKLSFLGEEIWLALAFMASCAIWALFALQDAVLAGLRKATWIPLENTVYSLAKIGALVAFAAMASMHVPIFFAWVAPLPVIVALVTFGIFRYFVPFAAARGGAGGALTRSNLVRFFGWDYAGSIAMMLAMGGAPLLVLNLTSAESMADYYLAWTITSSLYLIGRSMGVSLLAEGAADEVRIKSLTADALVHTFVLLSAALIVTIAGAPLIMSLFGPRYIVEGVPLLRVLALSCLPWAMITIYLTVARANGHLIMVAAVQCATMILVLGLGAPLLYAFGTIGMGWAWLITHTVVLAGIGLHIARTSGTGSLLNWMLAMASALSRFVSTLFHRDHNASASGLHAETLQDILRDAGEAGTASWSVLGKVPTQSDVQTHYVGPGGDGTGASPKAKARVLVKTASTPAGIRSLEHYVAQVERLKSDTRLTGCAVKLPHILEYSRAGATSSLVERKLPGDDGCVLLPQQGNEYDALMSASKAMTDLHARTAQLATIGGNWLSRWVDSPAETLLRPAPTLWSENRRRRALQQFATEQRSFWHGQVIPLGLGHGDYCPGNILFTVNGQDETSSDPRSGHIAVSAIVDWGTATDDAPPGFDLFHLLLTTRMLLTGQELGYIVCELLHRPSWTEEEARWLAPGLDHYPQTRDWLQHPQAVRTLIGLAWLHHVKSNVEKSDRYPRSRLWTAWNVERVLQAFEKTARKAEAA